MTFHMTRRPLTIHLVFEDGPLLTAACGRSLGGNGHTGHYSPISATEPGDTVCPECLAFDEDRARGLAAEEPTA